MFLYGGCLSREIICECLSCDHSHNRQAQGDYGPPQRRSTTELLHPSTLSFQLPIVPDQPQIRASETKPNHDEALTLILTLA